MKTGFIFISDAVVAITLFMLSMQFLSFAHIDSSTSMAVGVFASDSLAMAQSGATQDSISWSFSKNSICGAVEYFSQSGEPQDKFEVCACKKVPNHAIYSLAGVTYSGGFAKVTVCKK